MLAPVPGDIRGQPPIPRAYRHEVPAHNCAVRQLLDILFRAGWTLRTIARETPCGKSALANYYDGRRDVWPEVVAALLPLVATVVPAIPEALRRSLVLLRYDTSPLTPVVRFDTIILEVPRPELWLRDAPSDYYDLTKAAVLRHKVHQHLQDMLAWERWNYTLLDDAGRVHRHRREMGDIVEPYRHLPQELHPMERTHRRLRLWLDPFNPRSDYWFRVQFTPLHRDHQWFIGRLIDWLGEGWNHVRVVRVDPAFDFRGNVGGFVPVYAGRRVPNDCPPPEVRDGRVFRSVALGSRRGRFYLRFYDRTEPDGARRARCEGEWKPRKEDRPLLRDLPRAPFPVSAPIELLPAAYLGRTLEDRALLDKVLREGAPGLSPTEQVRLDQLRAVAAEDGVGFNYTDRLREMWPEALATLVDLTEACRHRPPPYDP